MAWFEVAWASYVFSAISEAQLFGVRWLAAALSAEPWFRDLAFDLERRGAPPHGKSQSLLTLLRFALKASLPRLRVMWRDSFIVLVQARGQALAEKAAASRRTPKIARDYVISATQQQR